MRPTFHEIMSYNLKRQEMEKACVENIKMATSEASGFIYLDFLTV